MLIARISDSPRRAATIFVFVSIICAIVPVSARGERYTGDETRIISGMVILVGNEPYPQLAIAIEEGEELIALSGELADDIAQRCQYQVVALRVRMLQRIDRSLPVAYIEEIIEANCQARQIQ